MISELKVKKHARYSVKETSEILELHRNTLLKYTKMGAIKCEIINKRKYYYGSDIEKFWLMGY